MNNLFKMKVFFILLFTLFVSYTSLAEAVIIAKDVEVHLCIEDAEMQHAAITEVKFDRQNVDISKKNFMNRKVTKKFNLAPGQYEIEWTTEKSEKPWDGRKETRHHRMVIIEISDAVVYINIRGENLTTY